MATLTGKTPAQTYKDLMQVSNNNAGIDSTLRPVEDGEATQSALRLSTTRLRVKPAADSTDVFDVTNASGTVLFSIDTTNNKIIAASGVSFSGDGSLLTSVPTTGSGGTTSTVDLSLQADSDGTVGSYANDIILKIGSTVVGRIPSSYANTLPAGIEGQYFLVADNWAEPQEGLIFDGTDDYVSIPDNANLKGGNNNFSVELYVYVSATSYSETKYLYDKEGSGDIRVIKYTAGQTAITIGDGTTTITAQYAAPMTIGWHYLIIDVDRTTNLISMTVDNNPVTLTSNDISTVTGAINPTSLLALGARNTGSGFLSTKISFVRFNNTIYSTSEKTALWNNGKPELAEIPFKYRWGSQTELVTNGDMSSATGWVLDAGWSMTAGKLDVASPAQYSKATQTNKVAYNKAYRYSVDIDAISGGSISLQSGGDAIATFSTTGTFTGEFINIGTLNNSINFIVNFSGITATIDNFSLVEIGAVLDIPGKNMGSFGVVDASSNLLNGSTSGSPQVLHKGDEAQYVDTKLAMTGATTLTDVVPKGYQIQSIYFKNTTANTVTGGIKIGTTAGGTDVVSAGTVGANAEGLFTLASDFFSSSADQTLYVDAVTSFNAASIDIIIKMKKVN